MKLKDFGAITLVSDTATFPPIEEALTTPLKSVCTNIPLSELPNLERFSEFAPEAELIGVVTSARGRGEVTVTFVLASPK